ncbi:hypothetical protein DFQ28_000018 [Apophysomyces sp. BC1034]|nr:hypothetical protein DFQ30_005471 [Apophysomyces sp. BC1015]KAG0182778.1 hypothetical protein DFQ29_002190 [Apophysomyces sp. BC1021]KAG0194919.1 hypothetical protein DFQ28_000018 [Apophysomyces sp. BC1034]
MRRAIVVILCFILNVCLASEGDNAAEFTTCVDICNTTHCPAVLPFVLRLTGWTCERNCEYTCMQTMTDEALVQGSAMVQYYGKWPFYRFAGLEEPASVAFSIGNGVVHYHYYKILLREIPLAYFYKPFLLAFSVIGINTWIWSTIFHARDLTWTQNMDYFSAAFSLLYAFYFAILRVFHVRQAATIRVIGAVLLVLFVMHVSYLSLIEFDFGYNIFVCVLVGTAQSLLWIGWCAAQYTRRTTSRPYAFLILTFVIGVLAAGMLEVFDFAPICRTIDAHSLWHLSTMLLLPLFYRFVIEDAWHEMGTQYSQWNN